VLLLVLLLLVAVCYLLFLRIVVTCFCWLVVVVVASLFALLCMFYSVNIFPLCSITTIVSKVINVVVASTGAFGVYSSISKFVLRKLFRETIVRRMLRQVVLFF